MQKKIIVIALAAAFAMPVPAMADSATDLIAVLIKKGLLTKEEGDLLLKGRIVEKEAAEEKVAAVEKQVAEVRQEVAEKGKGGDIKPFANVTIYGVADASIDMTDTGNSKITGKSGAKVNKISSNTSLIGFKGEEVLKDGLKAIWQIESEIDLDGTTAAGASANTLGFATRNTFVGLKSDTWGSLIAGRHDTPYKTSDRRLDLFGNHVADNRALMGGGIGRGSGDAKGFDKRATDTLLYNSPVMGGFKVLAAYVSGSENATLSTQSKGDIWSLAGTYDVAPFYGVMAYQRNSYGSATGVVVGGANGASPSTSEKAFKLGGGYKTDLFAINAIYEKTDDNFGGRANAGTASTAACTGVAAGGSCYGHKAFYLAGLFNITPNDAIKLAYTKVDNLQNGNLANSGARHVSLGYDHKLSKRTNVYAYFTKLNNDSAAQYDLKGEGAATGNVLANSDGNAAGTGKGTGASPSALSLGVMHTF